MMDDWVLALKKFPFLGYNCVKKIEKISLVNKNIILLWLVFSKTDKVRGK